MVSVKGAHVGQAMSLPGGRWDVVYPGSDRQGEELRPARGGAVDPAPINRGVLT